MPSNSIETYNRLSGDLDTLLKLHPNAENPGPGRPTGDTGPLLRAGIVLLVTAWENYVEQVAAEAFSRIRPIVLTDRAKLSSHLDTAVRAAAKKDPWSVTGVGWERVVDAEVETLISDLNNASSGQVDGLFSKALAIGDCIDGVTWRGKTAGKVRSDLKDLVDLRGEIVHKGQTYSSLDLDGVKSWRNFVDRCVPAFDAMLANELTSRYGIERPW